MDFSLRMAAQLILEEIKKPYSSSSKNIVLSPTSITIILSLLAYHGSTGETLRQFLNVLGVQKSQHLLNSKLQQLMSVLTASESSSTEKEYSGILPNFFRVTLPLYSSDKAEFSALPYDPKIGACGLPPRRSLVPKLLLPEAFNDVPDTEPSRVLGPLPFMELGNGVEVPEQVRAAWLDNGVTVTEPVVEEVQPWEELVLSMFNALLVDRRYPLLPSFKQVLESDYKALVKNVDLMSQAQRAIIEEVNSRAEKETKGLIKDILPNEAQLESPFSLVNALYLKATWHSPKTSRYEDFHLLDGKTEKIPFMVNENTRCWYAASEEFELLEFWFHQPGQSTKRLFSMYIFLPYAKDGLRGLVKRLGSDPASLSPDKFRFSLVDLSHVWIPKMDLSHEFRAEKLCRDKGLFQAVDKRSANFANMVDPYRANTKGNVYLRMFLHKARLEVCEEEAAEAEAEAMAMTTTVCDEFRSGCEPESLPRFVADHPFLFMVVEDVSKLVVFAGAFLNPPSE